MQETEPHSLNVNDSSTSNDDPTKHNIERYGQVNPGFVSSRPNSLYSHINPNGGPQSITDYEASRPPSALTSYSNFHGQRRVAGNLNHQKQPIGNQLTQESFNQFEDKNKVVHNASFDDDLPPPPPPLSSSPTIGQRNHHEDTDNNSSITTDTTAQVSIDFLLTQI